MCLERLHMNRTETQRAWDEFFTARRFAVVLALIIAACFAPVLFGFQSFAYRDYGLFGHPLAQYYRESFWRGEIPLWNPLSNCGLPFMAQWNTMVFYPGSLIYLLLPMPWSLSLFCLLHLYFGGLGMFFLARRWTNSNLAASFGGLVFALNGLALHCLMWPNNVAALGWMPWILLLVERAWTRGGWAILPAALAGACQFLAGAPEAFLLTWVVAAVMWLAYVASNRRELLRSLGWFAAVVMIVVALTTVQWLPMLELLQHSQRSAAYERGEWSMPPWGWANLLVPMFRTMESRIGVPYQIDQGWTSSYYFGVVTLWLALFALIRLRNTRVWALGALSLVALVLALGNHGFVWPMLKSQFSALGFIRYPVKLVFLLAAPVTLLAAMGLAETLRVFRTNDVAIKRRATLQLGFLAFVLIALIGLILWLVVQRPVANQMTNGAVGNGIVRLLIFIGLAVGCLWWARAASRRSAFAAIIWLLVIAGDFLSHFPWQNPTVNSSFMTARLEEFDSLRTQAVIGKHRLMPNFRAIEYFHFNNASNLSDGILSHRLGQSDNLNLLEGLPKADGFYSLYIPHQQDVQYKMFPTRDTVDAVIADVMAVGFMSAPGKLFAWEPRSNALPMISVGQLPVFVPESNTVSTMLYSNFNPHTTVLLPAEARISLGALRQPEAEVAVESFQAHRIRAQVSAPTPTMMVISQTHYPAWKAYVDGASVELWRANRGFQALEVPAGHHTVELRYEDQKFRTGAAISGALMALVLVFLVATPQARRAFALPTA